MCKTGVQTAVQQASSLQAPISDDVKEVTESSPWASGWWLLGSPCPACTGDRDPSGAVVTKAWGTCGGHQHSCQRARSRADGTAISDTTSANGIYNTFGLSWPADSSNVFPWRVRLRAFIKILLVQDASVLPVHAHSASCFLASLPYKINFNTLHNWTTATHHFFQGRFGWHALVKTSMYQFMYHDFIASLHGANLVLI